tara:strand:- start:256 stop:483 length:228 start_codon:yes stop_codon:yes gene_type:complete
MNYWDSIIKVLENFDVTEIFKTKGKLKRWSAKRSLGGVIISIAVANIQQDGLNNMNLILCGIGILPLCLSFFEKN